MAHATGAFYLWVDGVLGGSDFSGCFGGHGSFFWAFDSGFYRLVGLGSLSVFL